MMVCMAGLQVFIVRFFFQGARKGESGAICHGRCSGAGMLTDSRVCVREERATGFGCLECVCMRLLQIGRSNAASNAPCTNSTIEEHVVWAAHGEWAVVYTISWHGIFKPK